MTDNKFNKYSFDTDFFEIAVAAENQAQEDINEMIKEAAYAEGLQAGREQAEQSLRTGVEELKQILQMAHNQLEQAHNAWLKQLEDSALQVTYLTLQNIVGDAIQNYPQDILNKHLRQALSHIPKDVKPTLHISPKAAEFHNKLSGNSLELQSFTFTLQPDADLAPTDCRISWPGGGLEAFVTHAMADLAQLLEQKFDESALQDATNVASNSTIEYPDTQQDNGQPEEGEPTS